MRERPILMSGEMVRAILAGRKTQTRRLIMVPRACQLGDRSHVYYPGDSWWVEPHPKGGFWAVNSPTEPPQWMRDRSVGPGFLCPFGAPGDRLWVRETCLRFTGIPQRPHNRPWPTDAEWAMPPDQDPYNALLHVATARKADALALRETAACVTVPSIHMPRWASRLTLEVVSVRVQRLQEITAADICCEGYRTDISFIPAWNALNGKRAPWSRNPWVWAIEFRVVADGTTGAWGGTQP